MATNKNKRDQDDRKPRSSGELAATAASLGFTVVIFVVLGIVMDNWLGTKPIFLLVGIFFALASMVYFTWQIFNAS
jgi:F0F1-type ATP synthase assembly protein I